METGEEENLVSILTFLQFSNKRWILAFPQENLKALLQARDIDQLAIYENVSAFKSDPTTGFLSHTIRMKRSTFPKLSGSAFSLKARSAFIFAEQNVSHNQVPASCHTQTHSRGYDISPHHPLELCI